MNDDETPDAVKPSKPPVLFHAITGWMPAITPAASVEDATVVLLGMVVADMPVSLAPTYSHPDITLRSRDYFVAGGGDKKFVRFGYLAKEP